jgi:hypothetical protein
MEKMRDEEAPHSVTNLMVSLTPENYQIYKFILSSELNKSGFLEIL